MEHVLTRRDDRFSDERTESGGSSLTELDSLWTSQMNAASFDVFEPIDHFCSLGEDDEPDTTDVFCAKKGQGHCPFCRQF